MGLCRQPSTCFQYELKMDGVTHMIRWQAEGLSCLLERRFCCPPSSDTIVRMPVWEKSFPCTAPSTSSLAQLPPAYHMHASNDTAHWLSFSHRGAAYVAWQGSCCTSADSLRGMVQ